MTAVLTVNRVSFLGGVERVIVSCGRAALSRGFQPILACPASGELPKEARRQGIEVIPVVIDRSHVSRSPIDLLRMFDTLRRGRAEVTSLARQQNVRLLHAHHPISALYALTAAKSLRLPLLLHVHETLPAHAFYMAVAKHVIPFCNAIICVSEQSRALALRLGAEPSRVSVVYNAVDPSFLAPLEAVPELSGNGPHIGIFGVLEPRKGQDLFIEAAQEIAAQYESAEFWIAGELSFKENRSYVNALRTAIAAAKLEHRVHLVGFQSNVRDWMAKMDVIVLASRDRESLPTVLIEGGLLGRALVATAVGGVPEIIENGKSGLIVTPGDSAELAAAIVRALGVDGSALGIAAKAQAIRRFGFDRFGDEIATIYHSLVASGSLVAV